MARNHNHYKDRGRKRLVIELTPEEHAALKEEAWRNRMSMCGYVRRAVGFRDGAIVLELR